MTEEKIINGNKLITEFIGDKWIGESHLYDKYCNKVAKDKFGEYRTSFHDNWNSIMPVVEKIGGTIIPKEWLNSPWDLKIHFSVNTIGTSFEIGDHDLHITDSGIEAKEWLNISKEPLIRTWLCVVEFITWYNEKKITK